VLTAELGMGLGVAFSPIGIVGLDCIQRTREQRATELELKADVVVRFTVQLRCLQPKASVKIAHLKRLRLENQTLARQIDRLPRHGFDLARTPNEPEVVVVDRIDRFTARC